MKNPRSLSAEVGCHVCLCVDIYKLYLAIQSMYTGNEIMCKITAVTRFTRLLLIFDKLCVCVCAGACLCK